MWDKPRYLDMFTGLLLAVAAALSVYAAFLLAVRLPLREVEVDKPLAHVTAEQIEIIVKREFRGNFLTLNLDATRAAFERLPWVRKADVRRQWPDRLQVRIEEHMPLARWGATALVNVYGEVFEAAYDGDLPEFAGPAGAAKEITIQYEYFRRRLAVIGKVPVQVRVSSRKAWQLRLADGLMIDLGREHVEARLSKFVAAYERTLGQLGRPVEHVDLRYANGFAVRIPELRLERIEPKAKRGQG